MAKRDWSSDAATGVIAAWFWFAAACLFALVMAWEPTARMLAIHDYQADEIECRRKHREEAANKFPPAAAEDAEAKKKTAAEHEKEAREYCVQRRSAIAGERQGDIAKWAAGVSFLALLAAGAAVVFARRTVATMQDTAKQQLRAYVFATPNEFVLTENYALGAVYVEIRNSGHTPAKQIAMHFRANVYPTPLPAEFDAGLEDGGESGISIGPQTTVNTPFLIKSRITDEEKTKFLSGKYAYYVFLGIYYTDVFGQRRTTKICFSTDGQDLMRALERANTGDTFADGAKSGAVWGIHTEHCYSD